MKLLHVTPFYEPAWAYGGMARGVAGLCRALARRGHDVTVLTALLDPGHPLQETRDGVRVRRVPALFKRVYKVPAPFHSDMFGEFFEWLYARRQPGAGKGQAL